MHARYWKMILAAVIMLLIVLVGSTIQNLCQNQQETPKQDSPVATEESTEGGTQDNPQTTSTSPNNTENAQTAENHSESDAEQETSDFQAFWSQLDWFAPTTIILFILMVVIVVVVVYLGLTLPSRITQGSVSNQSGWLPWRSERSHSTHNRNITMTTSQKTRTSRESVEPHGRRNPSLSPSYGETYYAGSRVKGTTGRISRDFEQEHERASRPVDPAGKIYWNRQRGSGASQGMESRTTMEPKTTGDEDEYRRIQLEEELWRSIQGLSKTVERISVDVESLLGVFNEVRDRDEKHRENVTSWILKFKEDVRVAVEEKLDRATQSIARSTTELQNANLKWEEKLSEELDQVEESLIEEICNEEARRELISFENEYVKLACGLYSTALGGDASYSGEEARAQDVLGLIDSCLNLLDNPISRNGNTANGADFWCQVLGVEDEQKRERVKATMDTLRGRLNLSRDVARLVQDARISELVQKLRDEFESVYCPMVFPESKDRTKRALDEMSRLQGSGNFGERYRFSMDSLARLAVFTHYILPDLLQRLLRNQHIEEIRPKVGERVDDNLHEAIRTVATRDSNLSEQITAVIRPGLRYGSDVINKAEVQKYIWVG